MFGRGKKKKTEKLTNCFSFDCVEKIQQFMERQDAQTFNFHICKHHPEFAGHALGAGGACDDYREAKNEMPMYRKAMIKACSCAKLKKVV